MRVKVLKDFTDKHTGEARLAGVVFEVTKERLEEIQKADMGFVEVVKTEKRKRSK